MVVKFSVRVAAAVLSPFHSVLRLQERRSSTNAQRQKTKEEYRTEIIVSVPRWGYSR